MASLGQFHYFCKAVTILSGDLVGDVSMVRRPIGPKTRWSDALVQKLIGLKKYQWSERQIFCQIASFFSLVVYNDTSDRSKPDKLL